MGLTRHSGTEGELLRKHARLWVALAGATVIAGLFVGFGMSNGSGKNQSAKRVGIAARVVGGTQASASTSSGLKSSPAQRTELALPGLTRPLRDMRHVKPGTHHNKREVSRGEALGSIPIFQPHGGSSDQGRQRPDACADPELRRRFDAVRLPAARHRGRRGAEPLHAVGQQPLRDLHEDGHAGRRDASRERIVGRQLRTLPSAGTTTTATRSSLYDQYSGRWVASQFAFPNFPNGPFYQCVAVSTPTTRPEPGAATSTRCPRTSSTTIPSSGSGRPRTPTWPRSTSSSRPTSAGAVSASWRSSATR